LNVCHTYWNTSPVFVRKSRICGNIERCRCYEEGARQARFDQSRPWRCAHNWLAGNQERAVADAESAGRSCGVVGKGRTAGGRVGLGEQPSKSREDLKARPEGRAFCLVHVSLAQNQRQVRGATSITWGERMGLILCFSFFFSSLCALRGPGMAQDGPDQQVVAMKCRCGPGGGHSDAGRNSAHRGI